MRAHKICRMLGSVIFMGLLSIAGENLVNAQGEVSFRARRDYNVGTWPNSVAQGDFNDDGRPDLATANSGSGTVSILLGRRDGTFQAAPNLMVGDEPRGVTQGDFNGDGWHDLIVTINKPVSESSVLTILLGRGDGTFRRTPDVALSGSRYSAAVGDFNSDGRLDLATASAYADTISILLGLGDGTFRHAPDVVVETSATDPKVGDFNGDGHIDLATAKYYSSTVSVLLGRGNGTFRAALDFSVVEGPYEIAAADFNGDRHLDLAVLHFLNIGDHQDLVYLMSILLGQGDGTFLEDFQQFEVGNQAESPTVGDFNGDGYLDLATTNKIRTSYPPQDLGWVTILSGLGDGTFAEAREFEVGSWPASLAMGDFNADGRLDLAVANAGSDTVSILINTSPRVVNNFVTFAPLPATYVTSPDTKGCPAGFAGKFSFSARLTNRPTSPALEDLMVRVTALTNGNLVQNAEGGPAGVGAHVSVPWKQGYADGVLAPKESVESPFVICLKKRAPFRMLVDVVEEGGD